MPNLITEGGGDLETDKKLDYVICERPLTCNFHCPGTPGLPSIKSQQPFNWNSKWHIIDNISLSSL